VQVLSIAQEKGFLPFPVFPRASMRVEELHGILVNAVCPAFKCEKNFLAATSPVGERFLPILRDMD
jgi:hypothetical protein